jgi:glycerophosphoryl diester phosphodiesterase
LSGYKLRSWYFACFAKKFYTRHSQILKFWKIAVDIFWNMKKNHTHPSNASKSSVILKFARRRSNFTIKSMDQIWMSFENGQIWTFQSQSPILARFLLNWPIFAQIGHTKNPMCRIMVEFELWIFDNFKTKFYWFSRTQNFYV